LRPRVRDALLLTLTAATGSVDAVSYLGLGHVFTANMTGNLVLLGIAIGQSQLGGAVRSVIALAGFAGGVLIGVRVTANIDNLPSPSGGGQGGGDGTGTWPHSVTRALLIELGLLVAFLAGWEIAGDRPATIPLDVLVSISAAAMGLQAAAARRLHVAGVTTVFVTGMMTSLIADLATVGPGRAHWVVWAASLAFLVIGAAAGAAMVIVWRPGAPFVAVLLVVVVIAATTLTTPRAGSRELRSNPR
jgi:uncharacterized membrane protein YoaK (UPF0700 family)